MTWSDFLGAVNFYIFATPTAQIYYLKVLYDGHPVPSPWTKNQGVQKVYIPFWKLWRRNCFLTFSASRGPYREGNGTPLHYSCLENPWREEPDGLQSMGSHRVGHDWSDLAAEVLTFFCCCCHFLHLQSQQWQLCPFHISLALLFASSFFTFQDPYYYIELIWII